MKQSPGRVLGIAIVTAGAVALGTGLLVFQRAWTETHSWDGPDPLLGVVLGASGVLAIALGAWLMLRSSAKRHELPAFFLHPQEEERVVAAIEEFEKRTSGELRVHLQTHADADLIAHAKRTFEELGLTATRERNAVLFFVAVQDHRFAVLGDQGINERVPPDFWDHVVQAVAERFKQGRFGEGLTEGIRLAGEALAQHFPPRPDDKNELPNQLSRG